MSRAIFRYRKQYDTYALVSNLVVLRFDKVPWGAVISRQTANGWTPVTSGNSFNEAMTNGQRWFSDFKQAYRREKKGVGL